MVSVRRVAPILLLAVTAVWAAEPQTASKPASQPAAKSTAKKNAKTAAAPAAMTAAPVPVTKAGAKSTKKPAAKAAAKATPKMSTHPPRELHKVGDHWTPYNPPDPSTYPAGSKTYTVKQGDTLWALGKQFYNNAYLWPQLWEANTWVTDAHWIYPGDVLLVAGEVVKQAQEGAAATEAGTSGAASTTGAAPATPAPATAGAPTGAATSTAAPHVYVTAADAIGGTTTPVPLATEADIYCYGYIGNRNETMPNRISSWEDVEMRYQSGADVQGIHGSQGDLAFIDGGSSTGLNAGETYMLVIPGRLVEHPVTRALIGREYEFCGQVRVLCTDATKSRGLITQSCAEIPVGAKLKPMPQIPIPLARIPALPAFCDPASGKRNGFIISADGGDWLTSLGEGQLVQVNLGRDDQVQPGEFLTVFRDGMKGMPARQVLGELAVLTAENHTATAKIILMRYGMKVGDRVEMR